MSTKNETSTKNAIKFSDFKKKLKGIKYREGKDWEIFLPYKTSRDTVQKVLDICRDNLLTNWHIKFGEVTEEVPEPEFRIYWGECNE